MIVGPTTSSNARSWWAGRASRLGVICHASSGTRNRRG